MTATTPINTSDNAQQPSAAEPNPATPRKITPEGQARKIEKESGRNTDFIAEILSGRISEKDPKSQEQAATLLERSVRQGNISHNSSFVSHLPQGKNHAILIQSVSSLIVKKSWGLIPSQLSLIKTVHGEAGEKTKQELALQAIKNIDTVSDLVAHTPALATAACSNYRSYKTAPASAVWKDAAKRLVTLPGITDQDLDAWEVLIQDNGGNSKASYQKSLINALLIKGDTSNFLRITHLLLDLAKQKPISEQAAKILELRLDQEDPELDLLTPLLKFVTDQEKNHELCKKATNAFVAQNRLEGATEILESVSTRIAYSGEDLKIKLAKQIIRSIKSARDLSGSVDSLAQAACSITSAYTVKPSGSIWVEASKKMVQLEASQEEATENDLKHWHQLIIDKCPEKLQSGVIEAFVDELQKENA